MGSPRSLVLCTLALIVFTEAPAFCAKGAPPLEFVGAIPLPGVVGRIDHMAADVEDHLLFVAALGNNTVEVLDVRSNERVINITGLQHPQGILYVPEFNALYIANAEGGACDIYDGRTFKYVGTVLFSSDADNVRYDAANKMVYVGYGGGALGLIDAATMKHVRDIPLDGHPESFQLEKTGTRIFVNVPNSGLTVVDRANGTIVAKWSLLKVFALANFPMALDEVRHRVFSVFRAPPRLVVFDMESGQIIAKRPVVGDADDAFYDEKRRRIYVSGGKGSISVFDQLDADHYQALATLKTVPQARTSLFVPGWDRLYLAVPQRGNREAEIRIYQPHP